MTTASATRLPKMPKINFVCDAPPPPPPRDFNAASSLCIDDALLDGGAAGVGGEGGLEAAMTCCVNFQCVACSASKGLFVQEHVQR